MNAWVAVTSVGIIVTFVCGLVHLFVLVPLNLRTSDSGEALLTGSGWRSVVAGSVAVLSAAALAICWAVVS